MAVGTIYGLVYLIWSLLVAMDLGQDFLDWMYSMQFMSNPFEVQTFSLVSAVILVILKFIAGYITGWLGTAVFNGSNRRKERLNETM